MGDGMRRDRVSSVRNQLTDLAEFISVTRRNVCLFACLLPRFHEARVTFLPNGTLNGQTNRREGRCGRETR